MSRPDYVVVGGGLAGALVALELSRLGSVVLLERSQLFSGATSYSSGIVTTQLPEPYLTWALESLEYYEGVLGISVARVYGLLATTESLAAVYYESLRESGVWARILDAGEASRLAGVELSPGYAYLATMDAIVDPGDVAYKLTSKLLDSGVEVWEGVEALVASGGLVRTPSGALQAREAVILAPGAWARILAPRLPCTILYRCEASIASIEGGGRPRVILYEDSTGSYSVPEAGSRVIVGDGPNTEIASVDEGFTADPWTPYRVLEGLSRVSRVFEQAAPLKSWAAPCLVGCDGAPLAGPLGPSLYVLAGLDGSGLMLAPSLSRILALAIAGEEEVPSLLDPSRERTRPRIQGVPEPYKLWRL